MVNLKDHPYLIRLKKEDEELADLLKLPPDQLLLRWFNYHLKNANHPKAVGNFSGDVKDGEAYTVLLNQLSSAKCDLSGLQQDVNPRCNKVVANSRLLGVPPFI
jgi:plastin-1